MIYQGSRGQMMIYDIFLVYQKIVQALLLSNEVFFLCHSFFFLVTIIGRRIIPTR